MAENQRKQPGADCSSLIYERFCPARVFFILPSFPIKVEEKPTPTYLYKTVLFGQLAGNDSTIKNKEKKQNKTRQRGKKKKKKKRKESL